VVVAAVCPAARVQPSAAVSNRRTSTGAKRRESRSRRRIGGRGWVRASTSRTGCTVAVGPRSEGQVRGLSREVAGGDPREVTQDV